MSASVEDGQDISALRSEIDSLRAANAEAHAELDKQGAPPSPSLHARIRTLAGSLRKSIPAGPVRERLPDERASHTRKFRIGGYKGYLTRSAYADGRLGEVFVRMDNADWPIGALLDAVATLTSILLQYGIPLRVVSAKLRHTRFEPSGPTGDPEVPMVTSPLDYIFALLDRRYGEMETALDVAAGTELAEDSSVK